MKITKKQVRQAYVNPEKLKEFFPESFEVEIKVGNWYKKDDYLFCVTSIGNNGCLYGYGFYGEVFQNYTNEKDSVLCACNYIAKKHIQEATHKEVEKTLINEANKRGYREGVRIREISGFTVFKIYGSDFMFYERENILTLGGHLIFDDGNWAEIIPDTLEVTLDQVAEKFGVEKIKIINKN